MESQHDAILSTLVGIGKCRNRAYFFVSQNRLLELLAKYHSWNISRSTLNRRLRELEKEGYFERVRRHIRDADGRFHPRVTLYKLFGKIFKWVGKMAAFVRRIASVFRVSRLEHSHSLRESKTSSGYSPGKGKLLLKERNGSISEFHVRTGAYLR